MLKILCVSVVILLSSPSTFGAEINPLIGANITFGGDPLAYMIYADGSRSDLEAGRGLTLFGGASFDNLWVKDNHHFDVQTTLGVKFASTKAATNGEITFVRWPLEALAFYRNSEHRLRAGAGLSYHFANKISGSEIASSITADVDNALGFVIQGDYLLGVQSNMALGLRYENISYEISGYNFSASGNNFGIQFSYFWKSE